MVKAYVDGILTVKPGDIYYSLNIDEKQQSEGGQTYQPQVPSEENAQTQLPNNSGAQLRNLSSQKERANSKSSFILNDAGSVDSQKEDVKVNKVTIDAIDALDKI